jgi:hypothetical protein
LGKCSYDSRTNQYYGIPNNFKSINEQEIVSQVWLKSNFTTKYIQDLHRLADQGKTNYLEVYPGAVNDIPPELYSVTNPVIQYQQKNEDACVFFSVASVLHFFGYPNVATYILDARHEFIKEDKLGSITTEHLSRKRKRYHDKMLEKERPQRWYRWDHFINLYMDRSRRHHHYKAMAIDSRFDILQHVCILKDDEFIVSSLKAMDGEVNHVVCFTRNFIFDSNAPHALTLTKKALDTICIVKFKKLHQGFFTITGQRRKNW